ncbi:hypothetical protein SK128_007015 [Halocaridina rubra]|uniref:Uncharacterized protein n=1 Tax=Halocaridina rubra TaxID=373956 RepID=A0AAN8XID8_HALRR
MMSHSGGDVGVFTGGPGGAPGASLRLNQYSANHPPPAPNPQQPQQAPPQLRAQAQPPPHNPHSANPAPSVPHSQQHHPHTHASLAQHHHPALQSAGVGGHGAGGVGSGVGQVGVPPGASPAPPGPPHEISSQTLPPGSTQPIQQGSGGTIPVVSGHNMMYPPTTQNQPQGPQPSAQGHYYQHGGPNPQQHLHSAGQPRQVTVPGHIPKTFHHTYPTVGIVLKNFMKNNVRSPESPPLMVRPSDTGKAGN